MHELLEKFTSRLGDNPDLETIYSALNEAIQSLGFTKFAYVIMRAPEGVHDEFWVSTYPMEWSEHYLNNNFQNSDPIFLKAASTVLPFRWDTLGKRITGEHKRVFDEATEFGIANGITIPVRGPGHCYATFSISTDLGQKDYETLWTQYHHILHILAFHTHEAIIGSIYKSPAPSFISLYPRERECLLWTARGKTAWEIGQILKLSEDTVATYLKAATKKLGVNNKQHAIVKGIVLGIILP